MKSKVIFLISLSMLVFCLFSFAQGEAGNTQPDDEFNLFLLTLAAIFISGMFGAAIIGALVATLILFFLFGLMAVGVFSTSVAIGLYKRSFTAGFKSFLMIVFGFGCAAIGSIGLFLLHGLLNLQVSQSTAMVTGFLGGGLGGVLMGFAAFKVFRSIIKYFTSKLKTM